MGFQLREDLHFCLSGDRVVFLDLRANRYFALPSKVDQAFQAMLGSDSLANDDGMNALLKLGVITNGARDEGLDPCAPAFLAADSILDDLSPHTTFLALATTLLAMARAEAQLQFVRLDQLVTRLRVLKTRSSQRVDAAHAIRDAVGSFAVMGRWVSARDRCLPRSIAMARVLLARGVNVNLVIGVASRPFRAHCWVQHRQTVLNDRFENIANFTPILVV